MNLTIVRTCAQVTAAMSIGDIVCQMLEKDGFSDPSTFLSSSAKGQWDRERTKRMMVTGAFVQGPWTHLNYHLLEKYFAGTSARAIMCKVGTGALVAPFSISLTFTSIGLQQGKPFSLIQDKIAKDMPATWATGALYWPFVMTMNFRFVSISNRPLVGSTAGAFWSVYMAVQANKKAGTKAPLPSTSALSRH